MSVQFALDLSVAKENASLHLIIIYENSLHQQEFNTLLESLSILPDNSSCLVLYFILVFFTMDDIQNKGFGFVAA